MILSDKTIKEYIRIGKISIISDGIFGVDESCIQPASLDIRIGNNFAIPKGSRSRIVNLEEKVEYVHTTSDRYILYPGEFVLGTTAETIKISNDLTAFVEGRSSIGRLGLFVQNAGWVDPGFEGEITLELYNAGKQAIELEAGTRVAQLVFAKMDQEAEHPYKGKYQGQHGATGSMIYKDFE